MGREELFDLLEEKRKSNYEYSKNKEELFLEGMNYLCDKFLRS